MKYHSQDSMLSAIWFRLSEYIKSKALLSRGRSVHLYNLPPPVSCHLCLFLPFCTLSKQITPQIKAAIALAPVKALIKSPASGRLPLQSESIISSPLPIRDQLLSMVFVCLCESGTEAEKSRDRLSEYVPNFIKNFSTVGEVWSLGIQLCKFQVGIVCSYNHHEKKKKKCSHVFF